MTTEEAKVYKAWQIAFNRAIRKKQSDSMTA